MNMVALFFSVGLTAVFGNTPGIGVNEETRAIEGYLQCVGSKSLRVEESSRRPDFPQFRLVPIGDSVRAVSVVAGYSARYKTLEGVPALTIKFEISRSSSAAMDREIIRAQMRNISDKRAVGVPPLRERTVSGIEILSLEQGDADHEMIGFYSIFVPDRSTIATVYMLRPPLGDGAERTMSRIQSYRQRIMSEIISCMESP